jgi:hypothetical protein
MSSPAVTSSRRKAAHGSVLGSVVDPVDAWSRMGAAA